MRSGRQVVALARAEALLLWRSPLALLNAFIVPIGVAFFVRSSGSGSAATTAAVLVTSLTAFLLVSAIYYNLVTVLVARREELVLKRLRTGQAGDGSILLAAVAPAIMVTWAQIVLAILASAALLDLRAPVNPLLVLVAVLLGTAVFTLLALASTALTPSVELAQVTTMPGILIPIMFSGAMFPLEILPPALQRIAQVMPLTPVVDLLRLGLTGRLANATAVGLGGSFGAALRPIVVLIGWLLVAGVASRRWFRWEPRR